MQLNNFITYPGRSAALQRIARILAPWLPKGFAHDPLFLHPRQIELDFAISADRHLAVFTSPAYKNDINFDQWVLLTVSCLGRCNMAGPCLHFRLHTRDFSGIDC